MKILVTGASGFIGLTLCGCLLEKGHEVIASHRSAPPAVLRDLSERYGKKLTLSSGDLMDEAYLSSLEPEAIEGIVNAAIVTSPPLPESDYFTKMARINIGSTINLLEFATRAGIKNYVYVSSSGVYGTIYGRGSVIKETDPLDLATTYSITKRTCELLTAKFGVLTGAKAVSARISSPYGAHERVTQSRSVMGPIYCMARAALENRSVLIFGRELERDWTSAEDIVDGIWRLLAADKKDLHHPEYNISCSVRYTNEDIARAVKAVCPEFSYDFTDVIEKADVLLSPPIQRGIMDITRLKADTGFSPRYSLEAGIGEYITFLKNNRS